MLDIKFIRENVEQLKIAAKNKNLSVDIDRLLAVDDLRREKLQVLEDLQRQRNENSDKLKGVQGKPDQASIDEGKRLKDMIEQIEIEKKPIDKEYMDLMVLVPNIPSADTPIANDESGNVEVSKWGALPTFDFAPKSHMDLARDLDLLDMERGTKVAGYRGYYVKNEGVSLMFAYMMYGLNKLIAKGFSPMMTPTLVRPFALYGSGYFKGAEYNSEIDEIYRVSSQDKESDGSTSPEDKFLIGTAEPALLAYYAGETLKEEDLPIKFAGFSQCYRSEIGSYGKDTKGFYRVHEFMKLEQVVLCKADVAESDKLQQEMLAITKEIYEDLEIHHRVIQICTGDMSVGKYKAFDVETWMPSRNGWGEVGSASNFLDWQARRLNVRYIDKNGEKKYVYMINNTCVPTPRPFIAILENYQQADGSIKIPKVLQPFMGKDVIKKAS